MKYPLKNPNSEIRNPKEVRNPKSEVVLSEFWGWDAEIVPPTGGLLLTLHEEAKKQPQDLQERTALFGEAIIEFAKKIPKNCVNERLISQVIGAGTSIGEFKLRIGTCRKESKETMFFLRMLAKAEPSLAPEARKLWREAKELNLIFGAIWRK